jgi:uncharacterized damage-inducible protein DinB
MPDLRYPVGEFVVPSSITPADRARYLDQIAAAPAALRQAVAGLSESQLDTPYRDGGWTVRQVVHHVPDSHVNAYIRMKFGLTEQHPLVKPYDQSVWARTPEMLTTPIAVSLNLLEALHARWVLLMRGMAPTDFARTINHPEWRVPYTLDLVVAHYAWHGRHHTGHITELRKRKGW